MKMRVGLAAAAFVMLSAGCASGGRSDLSWNLGQSSPGDVTTKSVEVFRQRRFEIDRTEDPPNLMVMTRWRDRLPLEDEREFGVTEARTRFILEARPRSRTGADIMFNVRLRAENQGRLVGGGDYQLIPTTPEFKAYADEIAAELRAVLLMGIRDFQLELPPAQLTP